MHRLLQPTRRVGSLVSNQNPQNPSNTNSNNNNIHRGSYRANKYLIAVRNQGFDESNQENIRRNSDDIDNNSIALSEGNYFQQHVFGGIEYEGNSNLSDINNSRLECSQRNNNEYASLSHGNSLEEGISEINGYSVDYMDPETFVSSSCH